mmetsp:Transcript_70114/g.193965  ORF Transcript_70114/g.193965 Transcript_70114/m.193965 type:complete len:299 (+) Transcript_70114:160-1056(+)
MEPLQASIAPQRPQNFHTISLGLLIMLPALMFLMISFFMVFLSHSAQPAIWIAVAICGFISLVFMNARKAQTRDGPNFWLNLGFLCLLATTASTATGIYNWQTHVARYWAYAGQRDYTNVLPSEPALSHIDAGSIIFSADAHVDIASAASYRGERRFCVAPVLGVAPQSIVEYWAAGLDCCPPGGNFTCGAAADPQARAGLVYLQVGRHSNHELLRDFRRAAQEAGAAHGLTPSTDALFLRWVEDPEAAERALWGEGVRFLVISLLVHLGFSMGVGTALHCCRRAPMKSKLEDRRFNF